MTEKQKETVLSLLQEGKAVGDYTKNYLVSYKEYMDVADAFTDFCCERAEGKAQYATVIEEIIRKDSSAKVFVEVYGYEEEKDGRDNWIYADTLIILSKLEDEKLQQVIDMSGDIFPSDFGSLDYGLENKFIIDAAGNVTPLMPQIARGHRVIYFWWD